MSMLSRKETVLKEKGFHRVQSIGLGFAIDRDNCLDTLVMSQEILSCQV